MSLDLLFAEFRARIEDRVTIQHRSVFNLRAIDGTCRWVSSSGLYCFGPKQQQDTEELLSFFLDHPHAVRLKDFPGNLCDDAFCQLHAAAAKPHCGDNELDAVKGAAVVDVEDDGGKRQLTPLGGDSRDPTQWLRFGKDDSMHFTFGEPRREGRETKREIEIVRDERSRSVSLQFSHAHEHEKARTRASIDEVPWSPYVDISYGVFRNGDDDSEDEKCKELYPDDAPSHAEKNWRTTIHDAMHFEDVGKAEEELVRLMQQEFKVHSATPGYVYALRDPEIKLIKIVCTSQLIKRRMGAIQYECNTGEPLDLLAGEYVSPLPAYEVLEQLIKGYLLPHRWYFNCLCGKKQDTRHGEYFDISDDVVRDVFQTWRDFMLLRPYRCTASLKTWSLRPEWIEKIQNRETPWQLEKHEHHPLKLGRWRKLLREPSIGIPGHWEAVDTSQSVANVVAGTQQSIVTPDEQGQLRPVSAMDSRRHSIASPITANRHSVASSTDPSSKLHEALLGVPIQSLSRSVSAPSTPPRQDLDSNAHVAGTLGQLLDASGSSSEALMQKTAAFSLAARDHREQSGVVRAAITGEERITAKSIQKRRTRDASVPPLPAVPVTVATSTATPREIEQFNHDRAAQLEPEDVHPSLKRQKRPADRKPSSGENVNNTEPDFNIDWMAKYQELEKILDRRRESLPARSIREDLIQFRWPLAFALCLAAYSPYISGFLAFTSWIVFLPCLVAELRSWFPELDRGKY